MNNLQKLGLNNRLLIALCLAGLAVLGITIAYSLDRVTTEPEVIQPQQIEAVTALGRIEPQTRTIKLAPAPDLGEPKIFQLLVREGDRLKAGQTVAVLDNYRRTEAAVELARQEVKIAEADSAIIQAGAKQGDLNAQTASVNQIKAQLTGEIAADTAEVSRLQAQLKSEKVEKQANRDRLKAELRNAESELQRYQELATAGVISDSELDSRRLAAETAQQAVAQAKASYNLTLNTLQQQIQQAQAVANRNQSTLQAQIAEAEATLNSVGEVRQVDLVKAQAEVDKAISALRQAEKDLELTSVKAPTEGQVIKINAYPGEVVGNNGVIEFADTRKMMVVAEVYESDISRVEIGQTASITSETGAFAGEITGKVEQTGLKIGKQDVLNTDPAADVDSRVVEVKIYLDQETSDRVSRLTNSKAIVKISSE